MLYDLSENHPPWREARQERGGRQRGEVLDPCGRALHAEPLGSVVANLRIFRTLATYFHLLYNLLSKVRTCGYPEHFARL